MNPFDLPGPQFLGLYLCLALAAVVLSAWLVWAARPPNDEPPAAAMELDPYETAYLAGAEEQAAHAAIARLLQRGTLKLDAERRLQIADRLANTAHPLEAAIYESVAAGEEGREINIVFRAGVAAAGPARTRPRELGLTLDAGLKLRAGVLAALPLAALALFGAIKIAVGISRGRPVEILVVCVALTVLGAVVFFFARQHRSRRGDRALALLQQENAALRTAARRSDSNLTDADMAMAVALFGAPILIGGPLAAYHSAYTAAMSTQATGSSWSSGSSCSSGCGSSCGSSCGSGCGGGGGCGGCGSS